jgi:FlaA1/EpsC-like NDP-sugar epimerase
MAQRFGVEQLINVSTDKAVQPASILGVSKRISELLLLVPRSGTPVGTSLRLGNVLGSSGSVVSIFIQSLANDRPLPVTHPCAMRYFLTAQEACAFLSHSLAVRESALLLPVMGNPRTIIDLAHFLMGELHFDMGRQHMVFVGMHAGEKKIEQLTGDSEYLESTAISHIYKVCGGAFDQKKFAGNLERLREITTARRKHELVNALLDLVPEYTPSSALLRYVFEGRNEA